MDTADLQKKLIAVARQNPADDRVPYAFEKSVMARLQAVGIDTWTVWGQALWKSAVASIAVAIVCGAWTLYQRPAPIDLAQQFESAVFASASSDEAW